MSTSKLEEQLVDDLKMKLHLDMQESIAHFVEMCQVVDIPHKRIFSAILHVLAIYMIEFATSFEIPRDAFLRALGKQWDLRPAERRAEAKDERFEL